MLINRLQTRALLAGMFTRIVVCAGALALAQVAASAEPPAVPGRAATDNPAAKDAEGTPSAEAVVIKTQADVTAEAGAGAARPVDSAIAAPADAPPATAGAPASTETPAPQAPEPYPGLPSASAPGTQAGPAVFAPVAEGAPGAAPLAQIEEVDLWSRIRRGFKMPDLDTKRAQASTRWYADQPDYIARMTGRGSMYLFHIVEEIEKRGMPTELALLPFVESAMQPEAVSFAKAAGLWQFIPSTGRLYSLEQSLWKDERLGVIESTRAALDYLQKLYAEFGDWQLALAAYNCGEAGVERALAQARAKHRSVAYKDLRLPKETQYYVPKLQAIKNIVADPQRFGIELPSIRNQPYFVTFNRALDIDVATAARLADMPLDDFRALNPAFNRPVIVGASSPTILIPADREDVFNANLAAWQATGQPLASWTAYTLQSGETLAQVAGRVGVTEAQLRDANHIPPRYRPAPGSTVLIPRDENSSDDIAPGFVTASFALVPESANLRQMTVRVRRGDSLASVARRWHVSADDIVAWNNLHAMNLYAGQRLTLTVARAAPAPSTHKVAHQKATAKAAPGAATHASTHPSAVPAASATRM